MIPFKLLAMMRPATRPLFCGLSSGSLLQSRRIGARGRLTPDSLAHLFALQPLRLLLAAGLLLLLAIGSTAVSIMRVDPVPVDTTAETTFAAPAIDRIDAIDMSRWQL